MDVARFKVEGVTPLLMHNPAAMSIEADTAVGRKQNPTPEQDAENGSYRLSDGTLGFPTAAFRGCMFSAAKGRKIGKAFATSVVKGGVFALDELCQLTVDDMPASDYVMDRRSAVIGKARIIRTRPKLEKWGADIRFEYDEELLADSHIADLLNIGGRTIGVGDYRPEKSGPFGRFTAELL